jgi:hypothetical protein
MVLNAGIILFFTVFYSIFFASYYASSKTYFIGCYILLTLFHDFIFINLGYHLTNESVIMVLKSWQEILLIFLLFNLIAHLVKHGFRLSKDLFYTFILLLILTGWGILVSFKGNEAPFVIFLGWRKLMLALTNTLLLYALGVFHKISFSFVYRILVVFTVVVLIYGFYQYKKFDRVALPSLTNRDKNFHERTDLVLKEFWFYEKFGTDHMLSSWPNYMRNDSPRITSIFVSPIILSEYLAMVSLFSTIILLKGRPRLSQLFFHFILLTCIFITMTLSHTRIGFIQVAVGTLISVIINRRITSRLYWPVVFIAIGSLFFLISVSGFGDDSARGRLVQHKEMIKLFSPSGFGFSATETHTFDSLYISVILLFGIFSIFYFYIHFYWTLTFFKYRTYIGINRQLDLEYKIITAIICSFVFAFAFQYSIGSGTTTILYLLLFLGIERQKQLRMPV